MSDLPDCCMCTPDAERAETLYCAYQLGGDSERAGLSWDGMVMAPWAQLVSLAQHGNAQAAEVVARWRAVAKAVEEGMAAMAENKLIQAIATAEPASRLFHVKQSGFQDLGKMLGYVDANGNFHADNGALYGCIYSAVPVEPSKPKDAAELPKAEKGVCAARRVRVELVEPGGAILFDDGTWANSGEWTTANFLPDTAEDDIPF